MLPSGPVGSVMHQLGFTEVDFRGQCMSESLILGHNLDFSSCDIMVGFHKSSHICAHTKIGTDKIINWVEITIEWNLWSA